MHLNDGHEWQILWGKFIQRVMNAPMTEIQLFEL
jgi:hypothetical protein